MDIFLILLSGIFLIIGSLGCILPVLPGAPLSYLGILLLHCSTKAEFSTEFLILWAIVVIIVQVLDYYIPIWGTKKFGGSRYGVWGSTIGMVFGIFFGPLGIIAGPFIGAFIGELLAGKNSKIAIKSAFGSFVGFILGTISKLIVAGMLIYYYVNALIIS